MVRANLIAFTREQDSRHDSYDVNSLHNGKQRVVSNYGVAEKQCGCDQPNQPRRNADTPRAFFNVKMAYLRNISDYDKCRPGPTEHFHL